MKKFLFVFALIMALCVPWAQGQTNTNPLCFTADAANSTIELKKGGSPTGVTIQCQVNGTDVKSGEDIGFYRASATDAADMTSIFGFKKSNN